MFKESVPAQVTAWICFVLTLLVGTSADAQTIWNARQLASSSHSSVRLLDNGKEVAIVQRPQVARLVDTVDRLGRYFSIAPDIVLVAGSRPNAFATKKKDGTPVVGFNPAMLELVGDDVDLLGVVVGHELAHLELRHLEDGRSREAAVNILGVIAGAALGYNIGKRGVDPTVGLQAGALGSLLANRKFDRDQERAADELGLRKMHAAGFDVQAAPRLWTAMKRYGTGSGLWTSTHPSHDERIGTLTQLASAIRPQLSPPQTLVASALSSTPTSTQVTPTVNARAIADVEVNNTSSSTTVAAASTQPTPARALPRGESSAGLRVLLPKSVNDGTSQAWGYVDEEDRWVIEPVFVEARAFDNSGWAPVAVASGTLVRWGFINRKGEWEIPAQFAHAGEFDAKVLGLAEVRLGSLAFGETRFVDRNGNLKDR